MSWQVLFVDRKLLLRARVAVVFGRSVHATKVLREEIFTVEVIVIKCLIVIGIGGRWTKIAAPEAKLDVLGVDVPLPLVLRRKCGVAAVRSEWAGEWTSVVVCLGILLRSI